MARIHASSTGLPLMAAVSASAAWGRMVCVVILAVGLAGVPARPAQGSIQGLGDLPGGLGSHAYAVSADGSVVVGFSYYNAGGPLQERAFRWTASSGMQNIGSPDVSGLSSHADAITPDGAIGVGTGGERAFIWRLGRGVEDLQTVLAPPAGWTLAEAGDQMPHAS